MTTQILAMGGGGFSMNPSGSVTALDRFALELTGQQNPMVCFVPTASADNPHYVNRFLTAFGATGARTMVLTLWDGARTSVQRLAEADLIYVGGGSTVNLDALWRSHGVDRRLRQLAAEKDLVLAGVSAGASIWFSGCATDSFGGMDPWRGGLGLAEGSFCPHFDGEIDRAPAFTGWVADGTLPAGWAADDGAAVHLVDGKPVAHLSERPGARTSWIRPSNNPGGSGVLADPQPMTAI